MFILCPTCDLTRLLTMFRMDMIMLYSSVQGRSSPQKRAVYRTS